jgi:photosystem II stability/assembly factor-like uncharacterized protein
MNWNRGWMLTFSITLTVAIAFTLAPPPTDPDLVGVSEREGATELPIWLAPVGDPVTAKPPKRPDTARTAEKQEPSNETRKEPTGAMKALAYWGDQRAYPNETIPDVGFGLAMEHAQEMRASFATGIDASVTPWAAMGPSNIGGRTLCLALHPDDPDILYAGSASGGLWKSTTGGVGADAWDYVETGFPVLGVSTIAIDPIDPDVMYIGTGETYSYGGSFGGDVIRTTRGSYGIGILKTTDGGATWTQSLDWTYQQSRGVWMIQIHPTDPSTLYAATTEGIYKSIDSGVTWSLVHNVLMGMDVRIHPEITDIVFAAHGNFASAAHGIYRSNDAGVTWSKLSGGLPAYWTGKCQLSIATTDPNTIFASIANEGGGHGLYKSTNTGATWSRINTTDYQQYQGWYSHYVIVSPFDSDLLFTGGIEIWKSTNGGTTLTRKSTWSDAYMGTSPPEGPIGGPNYAHADHHFAMWHPTDPNTVFFASDGGVFKSTDLGENFQSLIGGYQTTQFYNGFSNSGYTPDHAMGGFQDNFTAIYDGTSAWRRVIGGDGCWTAINPSLDSTIFGSYQYLNIWRSYNDGGSWSVVTPPEQGGDVTPFVGAFVLCRDEPSVLYAGRARIYRSNNEGSSWYATNGGTVLDAGNPVISLAVATGSAETAYAGTAPISGRARVFATHADDGDIWNDVTGILPDRYPSDIDVDPNDARKVYVTFMGFGTSHVFKSGDGGGSWIDIGAGLPDIPTSAVTVDPDNPDVIYVGTDLGIYVSPNGGANWEPFTSGMPMAMVNDLKVYGPGRKLRAATHGNGAYERDLYDPIVIGVEGTTAAVTPSATLTVRPNPLRADSRIEFRLPESGHVRLALFDVQGRRVALLLDEPRMTGTSRVPIDASRLSPGVYYAKLESDRGVAISRVVYIR